MRCLLALPDPILNFCRILPCRPGLSQPYLSARSCFPLSSSQIPHALLCVFGSHFPVRTLLFSPLPAPLSLYRLFVSPLYIPETAYSSAPYWYLPPQDLPLFSHAYRFPPSLSAEWSLSMYFNTNIIISLTRSGNSFVTKSLFIAAECAYGKNQLSARR